MNSGAQSALSSLVPDSTHVMQERISKHDRFIQLGLLIGGWLSVLLGLVTVVLGLFFLKPRTEALAAGLTTTLSSVTELLDASATAADQSSYAIASAGDIAHAVGVTTKSLGLTTESMGHELIYWSLPSGMLHSGSLLAEKFNATLELSPETLIALHGTLSDGSRTLTAAATILDQLTSGLAGMVVPDQPANQTAYWAEKTAANLRNIGAMTRQLQQVSSDLSPVSNQLAADLDRAVDRISALGKLTQENGSNVSGAGNNILKSTTPIYGLGNVIQEVVAPLQQLISQLRQLQTTLQGLPLGWISAALTGIIGGFCMFLGLLLLATAAIHRKTLQRPLSPRQRSRIRPAEVTPPLFRPGKTGPDENPYLPH